MKNYTIFVALLLSACFGVSRQDFLQDTQNAEKSNGDFEQKNAAVLCARFRKRKKFPEVPDFREWSWQTDLNGRPHPYQGCALPTELCQQKKWRSGWDLNP